MSETAAQATLPIGAVEGKPGVTLVTVENFNDYASQELGTTPEDGSDEDNDPEAAAGREAEELAALKAKAEEEGNAAEAADAADATPKEGDTQGNDVFFGGKWVNKHTFKYRVHLEADKARKEADAKVIAAEKSAKEAKESADKAIKDAADLKAKYEPAKSEKLGPKPLAAQYSDMGEFGDALEEWTALKTRQDDAQAAAEANAKTEHEKTVKAWDERLAAFKEATPDFEERYKDSSFSCSDQLRDAIIESEHGPEILDYLVQNPEVNASIAKMTVGRMEREVGKLEAKFSGSAGKPQTKSDFAGTVIAKDGKDAKTFEPISPLRGGGAVSVVSAASIAAIKDPTAQAEAFKKARLAGKIGK